MSGRYSRAWIEVDLTAVVENARTAARVAGTRLLPVVKANAYGVGAVAVSKALETLDPWGYGVATVEEGAELRAAGITRPVLVFMPVQPALFDDFERFHLRSEEHTSELQSLAYLVCRLLLEKKK